MPKTRGVKASDALREQARKLMEQASAAEKMEMEELGRAIHKAMRKVADQADTEPTKAEAIFTAIRGEYPEWQPGKKGK